MMSANVGRVRGSCWVTPMYAGQCMQFHTTKHTFMRFGPNTLSLRAGDGSALPAEFALNIVSVTTITRSPQWSMLPTPSTLYTVQISLPGFRWRPGASWLHCRPCRPCRPSRLTRLYLPCRWLMEWSSWGIFKSTRVEKRIGDSTRADTKNCNSNNDWFLNHSCNRNYKTCRWPIGATYCRW